MLTKHLYLHIPFCSHICTYCDFVRVVNNNVTQQKKYLDLLLNKVKEESVLNQYQTIYLGGGTPNHLNDENLSYLLKSLQPYLNTKQLYEFTVELNPEDVTLTQVKILKKYGVNRVSLGVQTTNDVINKLLHRKHTFNDVRNSVKLLQEVNIDNISCDFIYNLPYLTKKDLDQAFSFLKQYNIKHCSFYSLEIKEGSILNKQHYQVNLEQENEQYVYINEKLPLLGFKRYEVASYAIDERYYSQHNLAYWLNKDWKAIGSGAYGFENNNYYTYERDFCTLIKHDHFYTETELYQHLLIMGLRSIYGLNLHNPRNFKAYEYYKDLIQDLTYIDQNNCLHVKQLDYLDDCLIKIV